MLFLENLLAPIPSEIVLPLAGFFVSRGELEFVPALVAATAGSLLGAYVLYGLGRWGGRPLVLRYGRVLRVGEEDLDRAEGWFDRYGDWVVLFARVVPIARSLVSIPAGLLMMPLGRFSLFTAIGTAVWNALLIGAGWYLGENWARVGDLLGPASWVVLIAAVAAAAWLVIRWRRKG